MLLTAIRLFKRKKKQQPYSRQFLQQFYIKLNKYHLGLNANSKLPHDEVVRLIMLYHILWNEQWVLHL